MEKVERSYQKYKDKGVNVRVIVVLNLENSIK